MHTDGRTLIDIFVIENDPYDQSVEKNKHARILSLRKPPVLHEFYKEQKNYAGVMMRTHSHTQTHTRSHVKLCAKTNVHTHSQGWHLLPLNTSSFSHKD